MEGWEGKGAESVELTSLAALTRRLVHQAPAAFCRKVLTSTTEIEMWGDGKQTRSFTFIDDCVEGVLRLTKSDFTQPVNLGSDEMVRELRLQHSVMRLTFNIHRFP